MLSRFLAIVLFVFTLLSTGYLTQVSADTITLTYANFPPASTFPSVQMERWAKEVEARTNGLVKVKTFPGGTLLPAKSIFDGVISGVADIGNFAMSYQPGRFPFSEAIDLPHGFKNAKVATMVFYDLIEKYQPKEFEKVKILTVFTCPPTNIMSKVPVNSLKDLKGLELRVAGTAAEALKRLGGTPVAMPQSETPEALQKGIVKGVVSSLEVLKDFKFASYTSSVTIMNLPVVSFAVVMNKDKWNALPDSVKKVLDKLSREQALWTANYVDDHVREALEWSKREHSIKVINLSPAEHNEMSRSLRPMIDEYIKKASSAGLPGEKIIKDINELKKKYERQYK